MMTIRRAIRNVTVYGLLVAGAVVFSFPFVWMASTSVKVDREVQRPGLHLVPLAPRPRAVSPYLDSAYFDPIEGDRPQAIERGLRRLLDDWRARLPPDVDAEEALGLMARGLCRRLAGRIPKDVWEDGRVEDVLARAGEAIRQDPHMVRDVLENLYRRFCLGALTARGPDLQEVTLGEGRPVSERLENRTPEAARIDPRVDNGVEMAVVRYDFRRGPKAVLAGTFDLPFDAAQLQRLQLVFRPDDTWHELWMTVEKNGRARVAERPIPLANFATTLTATWQEPGPDDHSTKLKTWLLLRDGGPSDVHDPRRIRLTIEVRKSGPARAWWNKLRLNYDRVLDQMPFWRYVRVSVFLVAANILLALASSSLVAYAFARLNWPGREFCFVLMLATLMIPGQVTMIPRFLIWKALGAYNTLTPLWAGSAMGSAFFIFLMRQTMKGIPRDLEDAARIDGCGFLRVYWNVILPLMKPSLAAVAIFTFMGTWNDFMGPLLYVPDQRLYSLAFGLYAFSVQVGNNPVLTMAASLLMTVPVIAIFFLAQKYFIQGITMTGMKA